LPVQDARFRGLVALGIGAVGNATVAAFGAPDSARFSTLVTAVESAAAAASAAAAQQPPKVR
jgi:hypothetical protein